MSPSVSIRTRETQAGDKRYHVRFRRGGRPFPLEHGGAFKTMREAKARRDLIAGEIAAGRDPREALRRLANPDPPAPRTLHDLGVRYIASRVDVTDGTLRGYRERLKALCADDTIGQKDPAAVTEEDVRALIAALIEKGRAPGTIKMYVGLLAQLLDFADVDPNPARSRRVKRPRLDRQIPVPPTTAHVTAILAAVSARYRLPLRLAEQTGMRIGEVCQLRWGDVDERGGRILVRHGKTPSATRWVTVPARVMTEIAGTCAREDRDPGRRVFPGVERTATANAMRRACRDLGIPAFSPHDLRHRYASLMARAGVPRTNLAAQLGHRHVSHLDVYEHVLIDEEEDPVRPQPAGKAGKPHR